MDRIMRYIIALFKSKILFIAIDTNVIETNILDVSFNIEMKKMFSYRKPNNTPHHIHSESHHPPSIAEQLLSMTNWHIGNLSCDKNEFSKSKSLYESALKNNGFNYRMKIEAPVENTTWSKNRKVIWTNPPYCLNVKTNIGKVHFTKNYIFFFQIFWKGCLSNKIALEYDFSCIIRKDVISLLTKISSYSLDKKWKMIFLKKKHGNMIFSSNVLKIWSFKKNCTGIWSFLSYYLGRW